MPIWRCGIPTATWTLGHAALHSRVDFTPYEGRSVTGKPTTVLVRGVPVVADGKLQVQPGFGQFVARTARRSGAFAKTSRGDDAMARCLTIAVAQTGPIQRSASRAETVDRLVHLLEQAAVAGAEIAVFPRWR